LQSKVQAKEIVELTNQLHYTFDIALPINMYRDLESECDAQLSSDLQLDESSLLSCVKPVIESDWLAGWQLNV
jgi:hypothetical protein